MQNNPAGTVVLYTTASTADNCSNLICSMDLTGCLKVGGEQGSSLLLQLWLLCVKTTKQTRDDSVMVLDYMKNESLFNTSA